MGPISLLRMALDERKAPNKKKKRDDAISRANPLQDPNLDLARVALGPGTAPGGYKQDQMGDLMDMSNRGYGYSEAFFNRILGNRPKMNESTDYSGMYEGPAYQGGGGITISDQYPDQQDTLTHEGLHDIWQNTIPARRRLIMARVQKMLKEEARQGKKTIQDMENGKPVGPKTKVDKSLFLNTFRNRFTGAGNAWHGYSGYKGRSPKTNSLDVTSFDPTYQNEIFADLPNLYTNAGLDMPPAIAELYKPFFEPNRKTRRDRLASKIMRYAIDPSLQP